MRGSQSSIPVYRRWTPSEYAHRVSGPDPGHGPAARKVLPLQWYDENRINQRLKTIEVRKQLTDERKERWILNKDYAILTDEITKARAWMSTREYKTHKWLKKESLRDNMSNLELILNMLAEASTTEISQQESPTWFEENKNIAKRWWSVAFEARKKLEQESKKKDPGCYFIIWPNFFAWKD